MGTYQDPETKSTQKVLEVGTITGENLAYSIQFFADPAKYSYYLPMIQRMMDSFQIDNIGTETQVVPKGQSGPEQQQPGSRE